MIVFWHKPERHDLYWFPLKTNQFMSDMHERGISWRKWKPQPKTLPRDTVYHFVDIYHIVWEKWDDLPRNTIIFDRVDDGGVSIKCRKWLGHPHLLGIVKPVLDPYSEQNKPFAPMGRLGQRLRERWGWSGRHPEWERTEWVIEPPRMTREQYDRTHVLTTLAYWSPSDLLVSGNTDRKCVAFCGRFEQKSIPWYREHRVKALQALARLADQYRVNIHSHYDPDDNHFWMDRNVWHEWLSKRCRVVICPFGGGEVNVREYEAAMAGCWQIRPVSACSIANPGANFNVIHCKDDWSDLHNALMTAMQHTPNQELAAELHRKVSDRTTCADAMAGILEELR